MYLSGPASRMHLPSMKLNSSGYGVHLWVNIWSSSSNSVNQSSVAVCVVERWVKKKKEKEKVEKEKEVEMEVEVENNNSNKNEEKKKKKKKKKKKENEKERGGRGLCCVVSYCFVLLCHVLSLS